MRLRFKITTLLFLLLLAQSCNDKDAKTQMIGKENQPSSKEENGGKDFNKIMNVCRENADRWGFGWRTLAEVVMKKTTWEEARRLREKDVIKNINLGLKNYGELTYRNKDWLIESLLDEIKDAKEIFLERIKNSDLQSVNLILGISGAGKTSLFNYLNGLPISCFTVAGVPKLKVDEEKLTNEQKEICRTIRYSGSSEAMMPNFFKRPEAEATDVDCTGEFCNKNIFQSIVNSYFKYELAQASKRVKMTLVINYENVISNRGTLVIKLMEELKQFIGDECFFAIFHSCAIILTNLCQRPEYTDEKILCDVKENLRLVVDPEEVDEHFKNLVKDVIERDAIGIFFRPSEEQAEKNLPYKSVSKLGSVEYLTQIIENTNFLERKVDDGIFRLSLQYSAQKAIDDGPCSYMASSMYDLAFSIVNNSTKSKGKNFLKQFLVRMEEEGVESIIKSLLYEGINSQYYMYHVHARYLGELSKMFNMLEYESKMLNKIGTDLKNEIIHRINFVVEE